MKLSTAVFLLALPVFLSVESQAASNGWFWSVEPCQLEDSKECCDKKKDRKACVAENCRGLNSAECDDKCGGNWDEMVGQYCKRPEL